MCVPVVYEGSVPGQTSERPGRRAGEAVSRGAPRGVGGRLQPDPLERHWSGSSALTLTQLEPKELGFQPSAV